MSSSPPAACSTRRLVLSPYAHARIRDVRQGPGAPVAGRRRGAHGRRPADPREGRGADVRTARARRGAVRGSTRRDRRRRIRDGRRGRRRCRRGRLRAVADRDRSRGWRWRSALRWPASRRRPATQRTPSIESVHAAVGGPGDALVGGVLGERQRQALASRGRRRRRARHVGCASSRAASRRAGSTRRTSSRRARRPGSDPERRARAVDRARQGIFYTRTEIAKLFELPGLEAFGSRPRGAGRRVRREAAHHRAARRGSGAGAASAGPARARPGARTSRWRTRRPARSSRYASAPTAKAG